MALPNFFIKEQQKVAFRHEPTRQGIITRIYPFAGKNIQVKWHSGRISTHDKSELNRVI